MIDATSTAAADAVEPQLPPPPGAVQLLLDPGGFFARGVPRLSVAVHLGIIAIMGLAGGIDRVSLRLEGPVGESWGQYWRMVVIIAVVAGPLRWVVGAALFRLRLRLSGARNVDARQARGLFVLSDLVSSGMAVLWTLLATVTYGSPREEPLAVVVLVSLGWSLFVAYRGARALFPVRPWRARVWLVILPGLYFAVLIGGMMWWMG